MADPVAVPCPEDDWTIVATDVKTGIVRIKNTAPSYVQTYRDTGGAVPTDEDTADKLLPSEIGEISNSVGIDVYVKAKGEDGLVIVSL